MYIEATLLLVPDDFRVGITRNTRYETIISQPNQEMADHRGAAVILVRPRSPGDKLNTEKFSTFKISIMIKWLSHSSHSDTGL